MKGIEGNSFFEQRYDSLKVLIIVPHEDDEINTAGSLLYFLSKAGAQVFLVYTTNGDWKYPAEVRIQEAVNSAKIIGIPESNIFFMGYGDAFNNDTHTHLFYHRDSVAKSTAGYTETYGTEHYPDFAYLHEKKHHVYTNRNYLEDLLAIIRTIHADFIICTDFDEHPDHRMLSLYFDKAMGIIKNEEPTYQPEIWKSFAYALAYTAVDDYTVINNPETKCPVVGVTGKYQWDMVDKFYYQWACRIRIPIPLEARSYEIKNNIISKALKKHKSQHIITKAGSIINSDKIFWNRRTDSLSYSAKVVASSGHGEYLNDFMLYNVDNIDNFTPDFTKYYWKPDGSDNEKKAVFTWDMQITIEKIVLYGTISDSSLITELSITLSDGFQKIVRNLPQNGCPLEILVGRHENVTFCELKVLSAYGNAYGLSECEFYSDADYVSKIHPFCKILINDNFVYEYVVEEEVEILPIECYCFGAARDNIAIQVVKGNSILKEGNLLIDKTDREIILKAQNKRSDIWDQIVIKRLSKHEMYKLHQIDLSNKQYLLQKRREKKFHNMLYILRHEGLLAVIKRTFNNVIRPRFTKK